MIQYLMTLLMVNIMAIDVDWSDYTDPIHDLFLGNNSGLEGIFGGNEYMVGIFIFLILFTLTLMWGLGMLVGSVVIIPTLFLVFSYIPHLRIIVAIFAGLAFGYALNKLVR